jgi:hypothetical protein
MCVFKGHRIRARGFAPSLSDSEILTREIVGEFPGRDCDCQIWQYFRDHWGKLFPQMTSRSTFVRQAANLWSYKQQLQQRLAHDLGGFQDSIHLVDGIPIPLYRGAPWYSRRLTTSYLNQGLAKERPLKKLEKQLIKP